MHTSNAYQFNEILLRQLVALGKIIKKINTNGERDKNEKEDWRFSYIAFKYCNSIALTQSWFSHRKDPDEIYCLTISKQQQKKKKKKKQLRN